MYGHAITLCISNHTLSTVVNKGVGADVETRPFVGIYRIAYALGLVLYLLQDERKRNSDRFKKSAGSYTGRGKLRQFARAGSPLLSRGKVR